jgi:hypothetical protein
MSLASKLSALALIAGLVGCTSSGPSLEPVPGSITYNGQPSTRLNKAPVGSTFDHEFRDKFGYRWTETYRILPDRSLEIVGRRRIDNIIIGSDQ